MVATFSEHFSTRLFALKFHFLDTVAEDLPRFGTLCGSKVSLFEHCNVHIKKPYRTASKHMKKRMEETV